MAEARIAVCLITADRYDYTKITLDSFAKHNDLKQFVLLQADDNSQDPRVRVLGERYGFRQIDQRFSKRSQMRGGGQAMRRAAFTVASRLDCTHALILENDQESDRPVPLDLFKFAFQFPDVYCLRLYGVFKERGRRRCKTVHAGKKDRPVEWKEMPNAPEPAELGDIHWGALPCITRLPELMWLHSDTLTEGQIRKKCGKLDLLTVRTVNNVFYHIGADRTPNFRS